ncbi:MAG: hypothetical protein WCR63_04140 [Bacilli bacterium]
MILEEKYGIVYVNDKRYYLFDMTEALPILDDAIPFFFSYDGIEVNESSWNKMALGILEAIDKKIQNHLLSCLESKRHSNDSGISHYARKRCFFWLRRNDFNRIT